MRVQGTDIISTANFLHVSSVENLSYAECYWLSWSFWQEKQLQCSQIKGGMHTLPTSFTASLLGSLSHPLIHFIPNTSTDHFHHSRQQQSWHVSLYIMLFFPHKPKTNRDLTVFLTGSRGRNQMSFLLRSARVGRKGDSKKSFQPSPPMADWESCPKLKTLTTTLKKRLTFTFPLRAAALLRQWYVVFFYSSTALNIDLSR